MGMSRRSKRRKGLGKTKTKRNTKRWNEMENKKMWKSKMWSWLVWKRSRTCHMLVVHRKMLKMVSKRKKKMMRKRKMLMLSMTGESSYFDSCRKGKSRGVWKT